MRSPRRQQRPTAVTTNDSQTNSAKTPSGRVGIRVDGTRARRRRSWWRRSRWSQSVRRSAPRRSGPGWLRSRSSEWTKSRRRCWMRRSALSAKAGPRRLAVSGAIRSASPGPFGRLNAPLVRPNGSVEVQAAVRASAAGTRINSQYSPEGRVRLERRGIKDVHVESRPDAHWRRARRSRRRRRCSRGRSAR